MGECRLWLCKPQLQEFSPRKFKNIYTYFVSMYVFLETKVKLEVPEQIVIRGRLKYLYLPMIVMGNIRNIIRIILP